MCAPGWGRAAAVVAACACAFASSVASAASASAQGPMHERKPVTLLSTVSATYRITQQGKETGSETFERRVYDDNTLAYDVVMVTHAGTVRLVQESSVVMDDESHFPRSYRSTKTIEQPADTLRIEFTLDMFANVAVLGSSVHGRTDSRGLVVPTGIPLLEVGAVYCWYGILFWVDGSTRDRQRIQWLDTQVGKVEGGEIYLAGEETIDVMGKKTVVAAYSAERDPRVGPAKLYVDREQRIVRCEQNMSLYELVEWIEK